MPRPMGHDSRHAPRQAWMGSDVLAPTRNRCGGFRALAHGPRRPLPKMDGSCARRGCSSSVSLEILRVSDVRVFGARASSAFGGFFTLHTQTGIGGRDSRQSTAEIWQDEDALTWKKHAVAGSA